MSEGRVVYAVNWLDSIPAETARSIERVRRAGYEVHVHPTERSLGESEVTGLVPGTVGFIAGSHRFTARSLAAADRLRVISRNGAGFESIDLDYCTERGIVVTNAFGANAAAVAEYALAAMLSLVRGLPAAAEVLRSGRWAARGDIRSASTLGRTLGLVGFGAIGQALARQVRGLGMEVLYYDVRRAPPELEAELGARFASFADILRQSDVVSLHVALNKETWHMIGAAELRQMKPGAFLLNTSRGGAVDEDALREAIRDGVIAGAALDVFETEPVSPEHPLLGLPDRFIGTPHVAGVNDDAKVAMLRMATDNLLDVLAGRRPPRVTNDAVYERHPELAGTPAE